MEIRPASNSDIRDLAQLWAHAFPGERTAEQRVRQLEAGGIYGGIETAFIAEDDLGTAAGFRAYRLEQRMHGEWLPMLGLAAVAVATHARRQGVGVELCRTALRHAYDRGDVVSVLYPFRPSFYEALGWGLVGSMHTYSFRPESLPVTHRRPRVRLVADVGEATEIVGPCYARVALESHGLIARTPRIWRQHLDWTDVHTFVLERNGVCAGYAVVHYGNASPPAERALTIRELIAVDHDAYEELMSWVSLQRDAWRLVHYDAKPSERFDLRLSEPRTVGALPLRTLFAQVASIGRGPMLRVVNVRRALELKATWARTASLAFTLHVRDRELPENASPINVLIANSRASVSDAPSADATLSLDASAFAQVYAGEMSVSDAVQLRRAEVTGDVAALDEAFRVSAEFVLLDEF